MLEGSENKGVFTEILDIQKQNPSVASGTFKDGDRFYSKPDPEAFLDARLGSCDPKLVIMIEDSYPNALGASKAGLNVFLTPAQRDDGMSPNVLLFVFYIALIHGYHPEKSDIEFLSLLGFSNLF